MDEGEKDNMVGWLAGAWIITGLLYQATDHPAFAGMCAMSFIAALYVAAR